MRKYIIWTIVVLFFLFIPQPAAALCWPSSTPQCLLGSINCTVNGKLYCCASQQECDNQQQSTNTQKTQKVCDFIPDGTQRDQCNTCFEGGGAYTAIGCISTNPEGFIGDLLRLGSGIAGGIAFLLILFGGFQIMTSTGNPERLAAGKELVGAAISGLLLIIFSIFLLQVIGVDILGLPTFTK